MAHKLLLTVGIIVFIVSLYNIGLTSYIEYSKILKNNNALTTSLRASLGLGCLLTLLSIYIIVFAKNHY